MRLHCSKCLEIKKEKELVKLIIRVKKRYKLKPLKDRKRECKKCHSLACANNELLKKARKNPEKYNDCNNCDRLFSKTSGGWHHSKVLSNCPYCNSTAFDNYEVF